MSAVLVIDGWDVSHEAFYDASVTCGREDISSQPDGSVLNATLRDWHGAGNIGSSVKLTAWGILLFHGWVTDLSTDYVVEADEWHTKITATGPLAMLGHALAGGVDYPSETDSQRVGRVLDETGFPHAVNTAATGPLLIARPLDEQSAAELARTAADSGQGVLWENPSDESAPLRYTPQHYRSWGYFEFSWLEMPDVPWRDPTLAGLAWRDMTSEHLMGEGRPPALQVIPRAVFADVSFVQTVGDYATAHTVTYGLAPVDIVERGGMPDAGGIPTATPTAELEAGHVYIIHEPRAAEIVALRFWHALGVLATAHTLTLWDASGTVLATAQTVDETDDAWAVAQLDEPLRIIPGQQYTVSYHATDMLTFDAVPSDSADAVACEFVGAVSASPSGFPTTPVAGNYYVDIVWALLDERPTVTVGSGYPHGEHETELAELVDATEYAELKLRQTRTPAWRLERFEIRLSRMALPAADELLRRLQVGTRMELVLPESSPVGERWQGFLEGWTHSIVSSASVGRTAVPDHRVLLQVSDRSLTEPGARWGDIDESVLWETIDPTLTWQDAISFG